MLDKKIIGHSTVFFDNHILVYSVRMGIQREAARELVQVAG
jgi:hypothetical protein